MPLYIISKQNRVAYGPLYKLSHAKLAKKHIKGFLSDWYPPEYELERIVFHRNRDGSMAEARYFDRTEDDERDLVYISDCARRLRELHARQRRNRAARGARVYTWTTRYFDSTTTTTSNWV